MSPRSKARRIVFAAAAFLASLALCEVGVRWLVGATWIEPRDSEQDPLMRIDPTRGYALQPDLHRRWRRADFDVEVDTDEIGLRDTSFEQARRASLRVLAVGDSFTFGIGVEGRDAWPNRLEARLRDRLPPGRRAEVVDAGVPGYSATQMRVSIEELAPDLHPQLVIFGLLADSYWRVGTPYVLHDGTLVTSEMQKALVVTPDGALVRTAFESGPWRSLDVWMKRHFFLGAHLLSLVNDGRHLPDHPAWPWDEASVRAEYAAGLEEIGRAAAAARRAGAGFALLMINSQEPDGTFSSHEHLCNRILSGYCAAHDLACLDLLPQLEARAAGRPIFRYASDQHWTRAAHDLAAARLLEFLDARGLTPVADDRVPGVSGAAVSDRLIPAPGGD